jgi:F-type H+-transporting ATPase subunit a
MHDALHQFLIQKIVPIEVMGVDISFTNSSAFMLVAISSIMLFQVLGTRQSALVPGRFQSMVEMSYEFIADMLKDTVGREGIQYFPFIFTLFMFILVTNLLGMIPFGFTVTSHIIVTFALAMLIFVTVTIIGFAKHGLKYFRMFFPEGAPIAVAPILIPIEIISYCMRPITLAVRLFANMLAGHVILKVFAGFTIALGFFGVAPIAINIAVTGFEFFVACIQAYIFTILSCLYLHDAVHMH